jgi:hypothetical protein
LPELAFSPVEVQRVTTSSKRNVHVAALAFDLEHPQRHAIRVTHAHADDFARERALEVETLRIDAVLGRPHFESLSHEHIHALRAQRERSSARDEPATSLRNPLREPLALEGVQRMASAGRGLKVCLHSGGRGQPDHPDASATLQHDVAQVACLAGRDPGGRRAYIDETRRLHADRPLARSIGPQLEATGRAIALLDRRGRQAAHRRHDPRARHRFPASIHDAPDQPDVADARGIGLHHDLSDTREHALHHGPRGRWIARSVQLEPQRLRRTTLQLGHPARIDRLGAPVDATVRLRRGRLHEATGPVRRRAVDPHLQGEGLREHDLDVACGAVGDAQLGLRSSERLMLDAQLDLP